jgi:cellobiose phosphorylase
LEGIYRHSQDYAVSRLLPGLPEYINARGRGMYPYLTGSASWYLLTLLTEVFGVHGHLGDLALSPKLVRSQFDDAGEAEVGTLFAGRRLRVVYHNPSHLDVDAYDIHAIKLDGQPVPFEGHAGVALLPRKVIVGLDEGQTHRVDVSLSQALA